MRLRVDVGIDADRDVGGRAARCGKLGEELKLALRFHVEAEDAGFEPEGELARRLADAGEDDLLRRHAGGERAAKLALGDDVGAGAEPARASR